MGFPIDSSTTHFSLNLFFWVATCCQVPASAIVSTVTNCRCFEKCHDIFIFTPNQESAIRSPQVMEIFVAAISMLPYRLVKEKFMQRKTGLKMPSPVISAPWWRYAIFWWYTVDVDFREDIHRRIRLADTARRGEILQKHVEFILQIVFALTWHWLLYYTGIVFEYNRSIVAVYILQCLG